MKSDNYQKILIIIGVLAIIVAITIPEIRHFLGLEKKPSIEKEDKETGHQKPDLQKKRSVTKSKKDQPFPTTMRSVEKNAEKKPKQQSLKGNSISQAIINNRLIAYYPLDGNAKDESGNGNDGLEYGGLEYAEGKIGLAANFDGINDYIKINSTLPFYKEITISFWVKFKSLAKQMMYTAQCGPDQHGGIGFQCTSPNSFRFVVGSNCTRNSPWKKIAANFEVGIWYQIVGVYSSNNYMALYVNGKRVGYLDSGIPQAYYNNLQYIGKDGRNTGKHYKAHSYMDDIRIYNCTLSKYEIKELYGKLK